MNGWDCSRFSTTGTLFSTRLKALITWCDLAAIAAVAQKRALRQVSEKRIVKWVGADRKFRKKKSSALRHLKQRTEVFEAVEGDEILHG